MSKKYLIVGGVAGGASTATRLRRLNEEDQIIIFEKGPHVSFSNCSLPYYLSGTVKNIEDLILMTPTKFAKQYNIDARVNNEVIAIYIAKKEVSVRNILTNKIYTETYDKLILSQGVKTILPAISGIETANIFTIKNVTDIENLKNEIDNLVPSRITIVSSGYIGIEVAENLIKVGFKISLIETKPQILNQFDYDMVQILHKELIDSGVDLILDDEIIEFSGNLIILKSGKKIESEIIIMDVEGKPDNELAKKTGLKIGNTEAIWVDHNYKTSDENIYAVGDAIQVYNPIMRDYFTLALAGPAQKQARAVANHINGMPVNYWGYIGSSVVKVFSYNCASTGLTEEISKKLNINYDFVRIIPKDKVGLMPDSEQLHFKLIFEKPTGRIIGAQAIGKGNVDKRIDVIATMITAKATIEHLKELELCYAPPFGSAKDVVNVAGYVASNILHETFKQVQITETRELINNKAFILDVREMAEWNNGHIINAKHIPLSELRERTNELPKDKAIYIYCRSGQRSYNAVLALQHNGYNVFNVSGGFMGLCFNEYFLDKTSKRNIIVTKYNFN